MTVNQLLYTKEEFARRGNEIYESQVRPKVEEGNHGKIVAGLVPHYKTPSGESSSSFFCY